MQVAEVERHSFITDNLVPSAVVIDLGMNRGAFSRAISEAFGCRVFGVEPVPDLYAALPALNGVTAENRAVTAGGQSVAVHLNEGTCATIHPGLAQPGVRTVTVPAVTLGELLERHNIERVALMKLDIEGAELAVLEQVDPDVLKRIDQLTVEFHDFLDPAQGAAVTRVIARLQREGFVCLRFSLDNTDVLFVNVARLPISRLQRLWLALRFKYPRGVVRRIRRWQGKIA